MKYKKIPAVLILKEHSERVPGKNLRNFGNKPLFFHIIETLTNSQLVGDIYIDTASEKIIKMAKESFDIKIIRRAENVRGDDITANQLIESEIPLIDSEHFLYTHATNPLLTPKTVDKAIRKYFDNLEEGHDSLFSVSRIQQRVYDKKGNPINHNYNGNLKKTQDLDPVYEETSSIFLFSKTIFNELKRRIGKNPFLFEINPYESLDIDEEWDFYAAEAIHLWKKKNKGGKIY